MKIRGVVLAALVAGIFHGAAAAANDAELLGSAFRAPDFQGPANLWDVDTDTGEATNPRETGSTTLLGVAFDPDGVLYATTDGFAEVNDEPVDDGALLTIDPADGTTTLIGEPGFFLGEGDLDFGADGVLYGVTSENSVVTLFTMDPETAEADVIGELEADNASAMAFDGDGELWILDATVDNPPSEAILSRIDPTDGETQFSVTTDTALGLVGGMAFHPETDELYVADGDFAGNNQLFLLDTETGEFESLGETVPGDFAGLSGLAFVPEVEDEVFGDRFEVIVPGD